MLLEVLLLPVESMLDLSDMLVFETVTVVTTKDDKNKQKNKLYVISVCAEYYLCNSRDLYKIMNYLSQYSWLGFVC